MTFYRSAVMRTLYGLAVLALLMTGGTATAGAASLADGTAVAAVTPMADATSNQAFTFFLPPTAAWQLDGPQIDVFITGSNGHVFHKFWPGSGGWQGWFDIGGNLISGPATAWSRNGTQLDVVGIGTDHAVWHRWFTFQNGWSSWVSLGGSVISGVGAVWSVDGQFHVVATGTDHAVWHDWWVPGNGWQGWHSLGGTAVGAPSAASTSTGSSTSDERFDVFVTGSNNAVFQKTWTPSHGWTGWGSLGGNVTTGPSGTWTPTDSVDGNLSVFAVGTDHAVWDRHWQMVGGQGSWLAWSSWGGVAHSAPAASYRDDLQRLDVFVFGGDGNVWHANNVSSGWSQI